MTYELAKQLKDAGYPQPDDLDLDKNGMWLSGNYAPTLEELIETCGDKFLALQHTPFHPTVPIPKESMPREWQAMGGENHGTHFSYQQSGFTPEEAVANLWLALNKK